MFTVERVTPSAFLLFAFSCCAIAQTATLESPDPSERAAAVLRLTDQSLLARVAMEDAVYYVRLNAVRELNDQSTLARIAAEDKDKYVQRAAFLKLSDPLLLATLMVDK